MKKADVGVAAYVLAAFIMMIVPIPNWLLDVLLACNIAIAFTILFGTMFSKEVLDMSYSLLDTDALYTSHMHGVGHIERTMLLGALLSYHNKIDKRMHKKPYKN